MKTTSVEKIDEMGDYSVDMLIDHLSGLHEEPEQSVSEKGHMITEEEKENEINK